MSQPLLTQRLEDDELRALDFLSNLEFTGFGSRNRRDSFVALSGLYANAELGDNLLPNRAKACFKDDNACVQTVVSGLRNILDETRQKGTVKLGPLPVATHEEAREQIQVNIRLLQQAVSRDFSNAYENALALEPDRQATRIGI